MGQPLGPAFPVSPAGTQIEVVGVAPPGDPLELLVRGGSLSIRRAEAAIASVVGRFAASTSGLDASARDLQTRSREIRSEIQLLIVDLQFQDRMSQILQHVTKDMEKLTEQVKSEGGAFSPDVDAWLSEMQKSYATAEERNNHHGKATVTAGDDITFF